VSDLVLVTGGAGRLGQRLVAELTRTGRRTRALVHRSDVPGATETLPGDLADPATLAAATDGVCTVVHLAAATHARDPGVYARVNVVGTGHLLAAARRSGVERFLHVSTRAISEKGGAYSRSKREAERLVERSGLDFTIVRLPEIYGTGGKEGVDRIVALARLGRPIPLVGRARDTVCPVHVDDAVSALAAAMNPGAVSGKIYTLGGECMSLEEFAQTCTKAFGTRSRVVHVPTPLVAVLGFAGRVLPLPVYPDQLARLRAPKPRVSPEAHDDLDFTPRRLAAGLAEL